MYHRNRQSAVSSSPVPSHVRALTIHGLVEGLCDLDHSSVYFSGRPGELAFRNPSSSPISCKRNIEMTPLCKIEVTPPRVLGSREVRRGGVVDEQAGVQSS